MILSKYNKILSLSYSLAKANFKVRNEGSYLGILWYLLNPLSFFIIFLYLRGILFSSSDTIYYPVYLMVGLIMFNFFSQAVSSSINLIRNNSGYIKSIKIPYEVFILSTVFQAVFSHIFELFLVAILFVYFHISLIGIIWYLGIFIFFGIFVLGLCFLFSTIGLYFNDFGNIWSIVSQLLFFITPVFYTINIESHINISNLFNPLFYFLTTTRDVAIYNTFPPIWIFIILILSSALSLVIGLFFFTKFKQRFAEYI